MGKELELYKAFIDGLVEQKDSVTAKWVFRRRFSPYRGQSGKK